MHSKMLKPRLILILPLISCLSCQTNFPTIAPQERCVVVLESDQGQYCRCHMYKWDSSGIGRTSESVDHEVMYCNKLIGFSPDSTGAIYEWQESIRLYLNRQNKKLNR